jgi:DNA-directed RNA polymerase subunit RPC12/RpoP
MKKPYNCHECGSIFSVEADLAVGDISFCPYCSSELYDLDDDDDLEFDDEDSRY